jgi:hypothetical protein
MDVTVSEFNSDDVNETKSKRLRRLPVTRNNDYGQVSIRI